MKDTHVLAAACSLALLAIVGVFIGYATRTLPQEKQRVITTSPPVTDTTSQTEQGTNTQMKKKKDCHCCAQRTSAFSKQMDRYIQRKTAENKEKR